MKVGILTLHNNRNKGALLQNYCLIQSVQELLPEATVETVDYRCLRHDIKRYKNAVLTKQLSAVLPRIHDFRQSKRFLQKHCNLSSNSLRSDSYKKAVSFVNTQDYDYILFGSDTVWKVTKGYNDRFALQRPFPNVYFGGTQLSATKVAYAASANQTDIDRFSESDLQFLEESIRDFSKIGVRDIHTENLLQRIGVDTYERIPDPTFIYDIPSPSAESLSKKYRTVSNLKEPIVGLNAPKSRIILQLVDQLRELGYRIVSPNSSPYADVNCVGNISPFEYYWLHNEFDFMITNSLHSTIFCLHHETPFITIDVNETYKQLASKTRSLLAEFELLERHKDGFDTDAEEINLEEYYELESSECEQIRNVMEEHRIVGRTFLREALDNVEKYDQEEY